jgi:precorrin-3B C17-methyltransferase
MASTIYVVGIGPGDASEMTPKAKMAIARSGAIFGYNAYTDLISDLTEGKEVYSTPMRKELDRCRAALEKALEGTDVALVSSGDPNVYGMASLMLEVASGCEGVEIEIVSGVTAALSGAARLGSPLSSDFAVLSLSDLMTPWETIEKRLDAAAAGDFPMAIYNPSSAKRADRLMRACDIILRHQKPSTPCGAVRNIGREGEEARILDLAELRSATVDMFTTVFVGNSTTQVVAGRLLTPRGYKVGAQ